MSTPIRWIKMPGSLEKLTPSHGGGLMMGIFAKSEDSRFFIQVFRYRHGEGPRRKNVYSFAAIDYKTPSDGKRYSYIPVRGTDTKSSELGKVKAAVEKWAEDHPVEDEIAEKVAARFKEGTK